jgi:hypothetical protein
MSHLRQKTVVRKDMHGQVVELFKFVHEMGTLIALPLRTPALSLSLSLSQLLTYADGAIGAGGMDAYPQPLSPGKEEAFEAEVDLATQHTEQGTRPLARSTADKRSDVGVDVPHSLFGFHRAEP